jgi:hypothetical protein
MDLIYPRITVIDKSSREKMLPKMTTQPVGSSRIVNLSRPMMAAMPPTIPNPNTVNIFALLLDLMNSE